MVKNLKYWKLVIGNWKLIPVIFFLLLPICSHSTTTEKLPVLPISPTSTATSTISDPLETPSEPLEAPSDDGAETPSEVEGPSEDPPTTNGPDYVPPSHPTHTIIASGECRNTNFTILIYPSTVDWNANPHAYKYNKAFPCEDADFSFSDDISLPSGEYSLITAEQGERGGWHNAIYQETFDVD